jgi:4-hydroxy-3-methylbut-2-enyl diphosphate reductase
LQRQVESAQLAPEVGPDLTSGADQDRIGRILAPAPARELAPDLGQELPNRLAPGNHGDPRRRGGDSHHARVGRNAAPGGHSGSRCYTSGLPMAATTSAQEPVGKKVILLTPRGFCAGVVRAIDVVKIALQIYGAPIYVRKEIVHNLHVVQELRAMGAIFVEEIAEVPRGARVIFSAHGVSPQVRQEAKARELAVIDATCPLVTKVHLEALRFAKQGYTILLIGHRDHDEVVGTSGEAPQATIVVSDEAEADAVQVPDPDRVCYLTQTTLSLDETSGIVARLERRFPNIQGPPAQDICYATENRQLAVKAVAPDCQLLLVVGSQNSSNSRRMVEVAQNAGIQSYLVDDERDLNPQWFAGVETVVVTAGASAPEHLVQSLIAALGPFGYNRLEEVEIKREEVRFNLPTNLQRAQQQLTQIAV